MPSRSSARRAVRAGARAAHAGRSRWRCRFGIWAVLRYTDLGQAMRAAGRGRADRGGLRRQPAARTRSLLAGVCAALAGVAGVCLALSFTLTPSQIYAWIGVVFAAVMLGGLGRALGPLVAGIVIGVSEAVTMAVTAPSWAPIVSFTLLIARAAAAPGPRLKIDRTLVAIVAAGAALALRAAAWTCRRSTNRSSTWCCTGSCWRRRGTSCPATPATSRSATARSSAPASTRRAVLAGALRRAVPVDAAGGRAASPRCSASRSAPSCSACSGVRGELFALLTLAVTFVLGTIVLNTPIDGGPGVSSPRCRCRRSAPTPSATFYLLALVVAIADAADRVRASPARASAPGLFAIHDDEDAAEVMGVPTYRYKLVAFAHLVRARRRGGRHPGAVRVVRDGRRAPSRSRCR